ncbi:MAG: hypothetical protein SPI05_04890 [Mobiluncus sp.]|nr:hypothetical protein [Mobiluncus sp.]
MDGLDSTQAYGYQFFKDAEDPNMYDVVLFAKQGKQVEQPSESNWEGTANGKPARLSLCAPGSPMKQYTKPFPVGKRLTTDFEDVSCAADEQSVICYQNYGDHKPFWADWDENGNWWY